MAGCMICLHDLPIFEGLDAGDFTEVCLAATKRIFKKGEYLYNQGDPADRIYLIKQGNVKLVQYTEEGREIIIGISSRGEVLGEMILFKRQKHVTSAIAMDEVKACFLSMDQLERLIIAKPAIAMKMIAYLGEKVYFLMQQLGDAANNSVEKKLTRLFFRLAEEYGEKTGEGQIIKLSLTQQDLANMMGASRVMTVHVIKKLKKKGIIDKKGKYYLIRDECLDKNFT